MFSNETVDRLNGMNLSHDTVVTMTYSDGTECFVHNETEVDDALQYTNVVSEFADMISSNLDVTFTDDYGNNVIDTLVESEVFELKFVNACKDEENEDSDPSEVGEFTSEFINENFYDQEFIEKDIEKYDHKRGFITLTATLKTTVGAIIENNVYCTGWKVAVPFQGGTFTIE
ncbi:MAG: hypothetical protein H8E12_11225 [Rhodobacteraceae bacterium]|nr:hypothetical protein [Paracoccaceae bacterium]